MPTSPGPRAEVHHAKGAFRGPLLVLAFGLFGPVGYKGTLKAGESVTPLQGHKDFKEALRLEWLFDGSLVRQAGMAAVLGGTRNPILIELAQAVRRKFRRRWGSDPP